MWQKVALLILVCAGGLYAQNPNPCRQVQNAATSGQVLSASSSGSTPTCKWITGGGGGGGGTVTSFSGSGPSWLTWTVTNPTTTPAASLAPTTGQTSHKVIGTCNAATTFAPCSLVAGDIPSLTSLYLTAGADVQSATNKTIDGVTPTVFAFVDPTSSIQTQLNGKQASGAYATCTGDLSGTAPGCTVSKINGTSFAGTSGHLVSFGAANIPADSGLVAANQVNASSPGVGLCHFAGSTQTCTSSAVALGGADVSGVLPGLNGGGRVLLEQHTASSSASLSFTTCFTSTYDEYVFEVVGLKMTTNGTAPLWRYSTDGGMNYDSSSVYDYAFVNSWINSSSAGGSANSDSHFLTNVSNDAHYPLNGTFHLFNPLSAASYKAGIADFTFFSTSVSTILRISMSTSYRNATAVNAVQFTTTGSGFDSGTIRCYGLAK